MKTEKRLFEVLNDELDQQLLLKAVKGDQKATEYITQIGCSEYIPFLKQFQNVIDVLIRGAYETSKVVSSPQIHGSTSTYLMNQSQQKNVKKTELGITLAERKHEGGYGYPDTNGTQRYSYPNYDLELILAQTSGKEEQAREIGELIELSKQLAGFERFYVYTPDKEMRDMNKLQNNLSEDFDITSERDFEKLNEEHAKLKNGYLHFSKTEGDKLKEHLSRNMHSILYLQINQKLVPIRIRGDKIYISALDLCYHRFVEPSELTEWTNEDEPVEYTCERIHQREGKAFRMEDPAIQLIASMAYKKTAKQETLKMPKVDGFYCQGSPLNIYEMINYVNRLHKGNLEETTHIRKN